MKTLVQEVRRVGVGGCGVCRRNQQQKKDSVGRVSLIQRCRRSVGIETVVRRSGASNNNEMPFDDQGDGVNPSSDSWNWWQDVLYQAANGGSWRNYSKGVLQSGVKKTLGDTVTSLDTRDAMEACQGLYGNDKEECFVVFGVDKDADLWYDVVSKFDQLLELETDPEEEAVHRGTERI